MIVESIVTTVDAAGQVNRAPMGVEWGDATIVLKPFVDTTTFRNVTATGVAVVNLVDDVRVFAHAALATSEDRVVPAATIPCVRLADCCSWRELRVAHTEPTPPRARIEATVVHRGTVRDFIGFNRAAAAVLEATIYGTRLHLLDPTFVEAELARLQVIVDKTAGPAEHEAMAFVTAFVRASREKATAR